MGSAGVFPESVELDGAGPGAVSIVDMLGTASCARAVLPLTISGELVDGAEDMVFDISSTWRC